MSKLANCFPDSTKPESHLDTTQRRTAEAVMARMPMEKMAVSSRRRRTGMLRRCRKKGNGRTQMIASVARLKAALKNQSGVGLRHCVG